MERLHSGHFAVSSLADEHVHRYRFAARLAQGRTADCACGIGYGSQYLLENEKVTSYFGIDPSSEAIEHAKLNYKSLHANFEQGVLEGLPSGLGKVDTFVMLETLEHVEDPDIALKSVRAHLENDGLLIGTVPSEHYERLCEKAYSPNPHHIQRFTLKSLGDLLSRQFESHFFLSAEFILGTRIKLHKRKKAGQFLVESDTENHHHGIEGSIFFIAGSHDAVAGAEERLGKEGIYYPSVSKARSDLEEVKPLRDAFREVEGMVADRDEAIKSMDGMIRSRDDVIGSMASSITVKDAEIARLNILESDLRRAFDSAVAMIDERDKAILGMEGMIQSRDEAMESMAAVIDARASEIQHLYVLEQDLRGSLASMMSRAEESDQAAIKMEAMIIARDHAINATEAMVVERDGYIKSLESLLEKARASISEYLNCIADTESKLVRQEQVVSSMRHTIDSHVQAMLAMDGMIRARDSAIASNERMIVDRDEALAAMDLMIRDRDSAITSIERMVADRDAALGSIECSVEEMKALIDSLTEKIKAQELELTKLRWWRRLL